MSGGTTATLTRPYFVFSAPPRRLRLCATVVSAGVLELVYGAEYVSQLE